MKKIITLPIIKPRGYQFGVNIALDRGCRYAVLSWPRRHGKDVFSFSYMVKKAMEEIGTYYYCFPTLEDGKEILWDSITTIDGRSGPMVDLLCPSEIVRRKNNSDHFVELINGSIIRMKGTDSGKIIGNDGKGFVFSEWQGHKPEMFDYIRPILRQNNGWAIFNGTMRGKENHLYKDIIRNEKVDGWFTQWLQPEQTKQYYWITPDDYPEEYKLCVNPELKGMINPSTGREYDNIQDEVDSGMSYAKAAQEFLNRAITDYEGAYFAIELQIAKRRGRIANFGGLRKDIPVSTSWDIGLDDHMAITLIQDIAGKKRVVGYIEDTGKKYEYYFNQLKALKIKFSGHYVPHDAKKRSGENLSSFITVARDNGFDVRAVPKTNSVKDDIEICRQQFGDWEIDLDGDGVELLYDHLAKYRENAKTGRPDHSDDSSNGGDSLRTIMMAIHRNIYDEYLNGEFDYDSYENYYDDEIEDEYSSAYSLDV